MPLTRVSKSMASVTPIATADIADNAITTAKIAAGAVATAGLADAAVTDAKLAAALDLSAKSVTLPDLSVGAGKLSSILDLSSKVVTLPANAIGDGTVSTAKIIDGAVISAKITDGAVTTAKIADSSISTVKIAANAVTLAKIGATEQKLVCKAWVSFNGTGTIGASQTINANYGVSSVTKNATGDYTINFTNAMTDANYVVLAGGTQNAGTSIGRTISSATTAAVRIVTRNTANTTATDDSIVHIAIFGN